MRLQSLKWRGIGRFVAEVSLPIDELGSAEVIAIVGNNGEGKTTAVECFPGLLYRMMPSRGAVAAMANTKDAMIEGVIDVGGESYTLRLLIDGVARPAKTEAYLTDGTGRPLNDGKARTYDAEIARRFPSQDVFLSSAFASQGGEGRFLSLPAVARKELFAQMLGLGRLQELSDAAGKHAATVDIEARELSAKRQTIAPLAEQANHIKTQLEAAECAATDAVSKREDGESLAEQLRTAATVWQEQHIALEKAVHSAESDSRAATQNRDHAKQNLERGRKRIAELNTQRAQLMVRLNERPEIEKAANAGSADEVVRLDAEISAIRKTIDDHRAVLSAWEQHKSQAERALDKANAEQKAAIQAARSRLDAATRDAESGKRAAEGLGRVPCKGDGGFASCPLIATAAKARDNHASLVESQNAAARALDLLEDGTSDEQEKAHDALLAVGPAPVGPDTSRLQSLEDALRVARIEEQSAIKARARLESLAGIERQLGDVDGDIKATSENVARDEGTVNALDGDVMMASMAVVDAQAALAEHAKTRPAAVNELELRCLRAKETEAAATVARLRATLEQAQVASDELVKIASELDGKSREFDEWRHLQTALGRNGIQALEIDAAGPEVSALCNELLHACYGSRFSVSLETTALKADGSGTKEVFELRVIDTERGTEGSADQLSGGEKVLVSEALSLAIAVYNTRRSSIPMLDLFRDECAGALSHGNAVRYVEMLRRSVRLGGFHRVYFIAHQRELWDLADERIVFADGSCSVVGCRDVVAASSTVPSEEAPAGDEPSQVTEQSKKRRQKKSKPTEQKDAA